MIKSNIVWHEFKQHLRSTWIWLGAMLGFSAMFLGFYKSLVEDSDILIELLKGFPELFTKLAGFSDFVITSVIGFFGVTLLYVSLVGGIQALNLGLGILAKEVTNKTSDFILTKPVSRVQVLTSKLVAGLGILLVTNLIFIPAVLLMLNSFVTEPPELGVSLLASFSLLFIQLFFLGLGFWLATVLRKPKNLLAVSLPVVFGFYVIGMLDALVGKDFIRYLTPFKFFNFGYIAENQSYEFQFIILGLIVIGVCVLLGYRNYTRKDIPAI